MKKQSVTGHCVLTVTFDQKWSHIYLFIFKSLGHCAPLRGSPTQGLQCRRLQPHVYVWVNTSLWSSLFIRRKTKDWTCFNLSRVWCSRYRSLHYRDRLMSRVHNQKLLISNVTSANHAIPTRTPHTSVDTAGVWCIHTGGMLQGKRIGRGQAYEVGFRSSPCTGPVCSAQPLRSVLTQIPRTGSAHAATHNITEHATLPEPLLLRAHQCQDIDDHLVLTIYPNPPPLVLCSFTADQ